MFSLFTKAEQTVETILSGWSKTIKDLEEHTHAKIAEEIAHNALIDFYKEAASFANAEANKARDVITKLKALFN
jgi:hypothetical protein